MSDSNVATANRLRLVTESGFKSHRVPRSDNPDIFDVRFSVRQVDGGPRYEKNLVLSFEGCSREDLFGPAMDSIIITLQRRLRDLGEKMLDADQLTNVSVLRDVINAGRVPVDPKVRAFRALMALGTYSEAEAHAAVAKMPSTDEVEEDGATE